MREVQKRAWLRLSSGGGYGAGGGCVQRDLARHQGAFLAACRQDFGNQCRCYRPDDHYPYTTGSNDISDEGEEGPASQKERYSKGVYNMYNAWKNDNEVETRRRIVQDSQEHQRRQARIIAENRERWVDRTEPNPYTNADMTPYAADTPQEREERRARRQRREGVEREERELRESRKNYKLPGYNAPRRPDKEESAELEGEEQPRDRKEQETSSAESASQAWLERQAEEREKQYWHSWHTCPQERDYQYTVEESNDPTPAGYAPKRKRALTKPPKAYDGSVRHFSTPRWTVPDPKLSQYYSERKPSGLQKQYNLACDALRSYRRRTKSHVFKTPSVEEKTPIRDLELPHQPARAKLDWQGMPSSVYKRFGNIKKAINRNEVQVRRWRQKQQLQTLHDEDRQFYKIHSLVPPRFAMTLRRMGPRRSVPIGSLSSKLALKPRHPPNVDYLGYGKRSLCDAWSKFSNYRSTE